MADNGITGLFNLAQDGSCNHKKYLQRLHTIYQAEGLDNFFQHYMKCISQAFNTDLTHKYANTLLAYASTFCIEIVAEYEKKLNESADAKYDSHPLFQNLITEVLKHAYVTNINVRYHACQFLGMVLVNLGDISISDEICDKIQRALLDRLQDTKPHVRCEAIKTLMRLQDLYNPNCPVIEGFINALGDSVNTVRKQVIENIAPCTHTYSHITNRLRDVDASVRSATFTKLSKVQPKSLSIVYRQTVIISGVLESNVSAKRIFKELLLSKWLKAYDSNVLDFMTALKLDANEEDINQTELIYQKILPIIFSMLTLGELVTLLKFDDDKRVPVTDISLEKITFWNFLVEYIQGLDSMEPEAENIVPPLTGYVSYIESYIDYKSGKNMEHWEYLENQQILRTLFGMLVKLDTSDEFGRHAMWKLIVSTLTNVKLEPNIVGVLVRAFSTLEKDPDKLAYELCSIIGEIKEPYQEAAEPVEERTSQKVQITQLKVRLHFLTDEMKTAVEQRQYDLVDKLSKEGELLQKQVKEAEAKMNEQLPPVRHVRSDMETICRCLDIMIAFMENINFERIPDSLRTFKSEFFSQGDIDPHYAGGYSRIFKLTCLYSILDKTIATDNLETIYTPVVAYRVSPVFDEKILQLSVSAISDLMRVHGPDLFDKISLPQAKRQNKEKKRGNDRTLYCENGYVSDSEVHSLASIADLTPDVLIDIILSMLDDNSPEIRSCAAVAVSKLVMKGVCVNSSLVTRLLLKWFNPSLNSDEKSDQKIQRYIGFALSKYFQDTKDGLEVLEKAIIPTLCFIGNAPPTSPLFDIDFDNVLECLINFTKFRENETVTIHKSLAYSILSKISNKSRDSATKILAKMLLYLSISMDEPTIVRELSQQIETAQENVTDKAALTYLKKFYNKLNGITAEVADSRNLTGATNETTRTSATPNKGRKRRPIASTNELPPIEEQATADVTEDNETSATPAIQRKETSHNAAEDTIPSRIEEQSNEDNDTSSVSPTKVPRRLRSSNSSEDDTLHTIHERTNGIEQSPMNDSSRILTPSLNGRKLKSTTPATKTQRKEKSLIDDRNSTPAPSLNGRKLRSATPATPASKTQRKEKSLIDDRNSTPAPSLNGRKLRSATPATPASKTQRNENKTPLTNSRRTRGRNHNNSQSHDLETIDDLHTEELSDDSYTIQTPSTNSTVSSGSGSIKTAEKKNGEEALVTMSAKRKKGRGQRKSNPHQENNDSPNTRTRTSARLSSRTSSEYDGNTSLTDCSSDSDSIFKPRTRKSQRSK